VSLARVWARLRSGRAVPAAVTKRNSLGPGDARGVVPDAQVCWHLWRRSGAALTRLTPTPSSSSTSTRSRASSTTSRSSAPAASVAAHDVRMPFVRASSDIAFAIAWVVFAVPVLLAWRKVLAAARRRHHPPVHPHRRRRDQRNAESERPRRLGHAMRGIAGSRSVGRGLVVLPRKPSSVPAALRAQNCLGPRKRPPGPALSRRVSGRHAGRGQTTRRHRGARALLRPSGLT
jgi:hypothetical protein